MPKQPPASGEHARAAVVGLGPMGEPIARNLVASGLSTLVWNRSSAPVERLVAAGARRAHRPRDVVADVVLAVLPDVDQLMEVLDGPDGLLHGLVRARGHLAVLSTTSPGKITSLADRLNPLGISLVDAPMSGGDVGAQNRALAFMAGGDPADITAVAPVLQLLGTVHHMGPLGSGALTKLCNQLVVAGVLAATADALAAAEAADLDPDAVVLDVFAGGLADSAVLRLKRAKLVGGDYSLGGSARNQVKDLRYARSTFEGVYPSPVLPVLLDLFEETLVRGLGDRDHSAIIEVLRQRVARFGRRRDGDPLDP